jgi:hypothetical protein
MSLQLNVPRLEENISLYVRIVPKFMKTSNKSAVCRQDCSENSKKIDNSEKNILTTSSSNIIDYSVNYGLSRSGARHRALVQTNGTARGLGINSPLSAETHAQDL